MDSDAHVVPVTKHTCGARDPKGRPCQGVPSIPCPKCLLIAYCGPECRQRHWAAKHKHACLADMVARPRLIDSEVDEEATTYGNTAWSSSAATDVLNLDKNEGRFYNDYLQLLFTGEAGLRHLIYSVDKMPETASPMLSVCINESNHFNLTRTLFAMHLLFSHEHDPVLNAEAVIHLWYSSRMPKALHDHINSVVRKHVIYTLDDISCYYGSEELPDAQPCRSHTSQVNMSMDVELKRAEWMAVKKRLDASCVGLAESVVLRYLDKARNAEPPERVLARMTRARYAGMRKWHEDGLLLPYGHPRDGFDTLNPLFFVGKDKFPVGATTEPLSEWPIEVLDYEGCAAPNDVYGKMFWYLRDLLVRFQRRVAKIHVKMLLTCESGATLPNWLPTLKLDREFDRIEVGSLFDQHPFLTLGLFSKLLRHQDENPYATVLTLTRDTVTHDMSCVRGTLDAEKLDMRRPTNTILDEHAPPVDSDDLTKRDAIRRKIGLLMWRNWDKFSSRFLNSPTRFAFASLMHPERMVEHRSVIQTGFLGLAVREKHMIVRRWPNRLVHSKKDKPSLRDFNRCLGWPNTAPERWLEWKRREDLPELEWLSWLGLAGSRSRLAFELELEDIVLGIMGDDESGHGLEKAMGEVTLEIRGTLDYDSEATIDANDWAAEVQRQVDEDELKKAKAEDELKKAEPDAELKMTTFGTIDWAAEVQRQVDEDELKKAKAEAELKRTMIGTIDWAEEVQRQVDEEELKKAEAELKKAKAEDELKKAGAETALKKVEAGTELKAGAGETETQKDKGKKKSKKSKKSKK